MSPLTRLQKLSAHLTPSPSPSPTPAKRSGERGGTRCHANNYHTLSPTAFLWRAATIEPDVGFPFPFPSDGSLCGLSYAAPLSRPQQCITAPPTVGSCAARTQRLQSARPAWPISCASGATGGWASCAQTRPLFWRRCSALRPPGESASVCSSAMSAFFAQ